MIDYEKLKYAHKIIVDNISDNYNISIVFMGEDREPEFSCQFGETRIEHMKIDCLIKHLTGIATPYSTYKIGDVIYYAEHSNLSPFPVICKSKINDIYKDEYGDVIIETDTNSIMECFTYSSSRALSEAQARYWSGICRMEYKKACLTPKPEKENSCSHKWDLCFYDEAGNICDPKESLNGKCKCEYCGEFFA
ncbi:MAG: hypothetical protein P9L97_08895 [Candidatus Tenebribacter davisii]|nr:hypothetical protein [Candidatus Tenebribacter davisii]